MPAITFQDQRIECTPGETVLSALLRSGVSVSNSCRAGACQSCLMKVVDGGVPPYKAESGLKDTLRAQGYILSCCCVPSADITVAMPGESMKSKARVVELSDLGARVMRVRLQCDEPFDFRAGQYVTLIREDGLARSYSIASLPDDGFIELHVRRVEGGRMSSWIHDDLRPGAHVQLMGPAGNCFYVPGRPDQNILLAGTGTGLAPLVGIARDALKNGHTGSVKLFHGALDPGALYHRDELREVARSHTQMSYHASVLGNAGPEEMEGPLDKHISEVCGPLKGWRAYVCGDPAIVKKLQKYLFLQGVSMKEILADAFLPTASG